MPSDCCCTATTGDPYTGGNASGTRTSSSAKLLPANVPRGDGAAEATTKLSPVTAVRLRRCRPSSRSPRRGRPGRGLVPPRRGRRQSTPCAPTMCRRAAGQRRTPRFWSLSVIVRTVVPSSASRTRRTVAPESDLLTATAYSLCAADDSDVDLGSGTHCGGFPRPGRRGTWRGQVGQQHTSRGAARRRGGAAAGGEQPRTDHAGYEQEHGDERTEQQCGADRAGHRAGIGGVSTGGTGRQGCARRVGIWRSSDASVASLAGASGMSRPVAVTGRGAWRHGRTGLSSGPRVRAGWSRVG